MYIIGKEVFKTKKAAEEKIRKVLHSYKHDEFLEVEDELFIVDLLVNHPDASQKIGVGIAGIKVQQNPYYKRNKQFVIVRKDGTETDFSFKKCITKPKMETKFQQACRNAVAPYIIKFKKDFFIENEEPTCEITGIELTFQNSHVDHVPPNTFKAIVQNFIESEEIDIASVAFAPTADNQYGIHFLDDFFAQKWIAYHNDKAELRVISKIANLSHVKRQEI